MKYGIITHYDVHNHGALLQLYAMKRILGSFDIEATALQFDKNYDFMGVANKAKYEISLKSVGVYVRFLLQRGVGSTFFNYNKRRILNEFRKKSNLIGPYYSECENLDGVVIGSDEVFALHTGITPVFFGHALPSLKVFAYGGCFGPTTMADIDKWHCRALISSGLNEMCGLGMRDQNSLYITKQLTGREGTLVCDPVILYSYKDELAHVVRPCQSPYMLVYSYDNKFDNQAQVIKEYAAKKGLKIISPGFYHKWVDANVNVDPIELLTWFKFAECVVTNTFHGCVLSIITGREMAVMIRDNANKLQNLIKEYNIEDRVFDEIKTLEGVLEGMVNWDDVNQQLCQRRAESMDYLKQMIAK